MSQRREGTIQCCIGNSYRHNSDLHKYIVEKYIEKRCPKAQGNDTKKGASNYMYITPRTLLGIIRLSQAIARLGFRDYVCREDVDEALRLMDACKTSIMDDSGKEGGKFFIYIIEFKRMDTASAIYSLIKELFNKAKTYKLKRDLIENEIIPLGYSQENIRKCISEYMSLNVLGYDENTGEVTYCAK